ncbi:MAG: transglutaminase-like domain-containing protein [Elusimicrobiota bacterium]
MSAPPLLIGAGLLFWGYQTGMLIPAAGMALLLEASRALPRRLDLSRSNFHRMSDLCALIFTAAAIYSYAVDGASDAFRMISQRMPMFLFPLIAAQAGSVQRGVDASTFFWSFRKRQQARGPRRFVDFTYLYFTACLLAAGAANLRSPVFYGGMFLLTAWALWRVKPVRTSAAAWGAMLLIAGAAGYQGQLGLHGLQRQMEQVVAKVAMGLVGVRKNPFKSSTAMGTIGKLKQSDNILLRVKTPGGEYPPALLRNAAYNKYKGTSWFAGKASFRELARGTRETTWEIAATTRAANRVRISGYLPGGEGVLALPHGASRIDGLLASAVSVNDLGSVKVVDAPGLVVYAVSYGRDEARDGAPDEDDLAVPPHLRRILARISGELRLSAQRPREAVSALSAYFSEGFQYSIFQKERPLGASPVADFLERTKTGHCEFFAASAALLLRAAGIPARYATGYAVEEFSALENAYVVRQRHAHAWTRVYVDGKWQDLDTTPATWSEVEKEDVSALQPLRDALSWLKFRFSKWRWSGSEERDGSRVGWILIPLILLMAWRVYAALRSARLKREEEENAARVVVPGEDSEFYEIEDVLAKSGRGRNSWESPSGWLKRLENTEGGLIRPLRVLVDLHYRHRFDPEGLDAEGRAALREGVRTWLEEQKHE